MKFIAVLFWAAASCLPLRAAGLADEVLAEINFARTAPQQYAQVLAERSIGYRGIEGERVVADAVRFLQKQKPLPALAFSEGIQNSALTHVLDMGPIGGRGHRGTNGSQPWDRMTRFGKWLGSAGENIDYGQQDARGVVVRLIVDDNVRGRGHRKNIFNQDFRVAGAATGDHTIYGAMCVIDFAAGYIEAADLVAGRSVRRAIPL